ncbi:carbonic anhydrase [Streptomyces sp. DSM 118148]|uniref:carbonic anhydrase n=1 Tax=Streptomyces sp. DSM 118148 TaxID=3448667 RepID=UPI00403FF5FA
MTRTRSSAYASPRQGRSTRSSPHHHAPQRSSHLLITQPDRPRVAGAQGSHLLAERPGAAPDRGLGDLFVVRTAGHVMGPEALGSIEFGVDVLGCPLVVVLGHDSCGGVGAACAALETGMTPAGYVRDVVERVTPSVLAARAAGQVEPDQILAEHTRHTADLLLDRSRVLADKVAAGQAAVVGLRYRLADGSAQLVAARGLDATVPAAS